MEVKVILTVDDRLEALVDKVLNAIAIKPEVQVTAQEVKEVEVVQSQLQEEKPKKAKAKKKEEPTPPVEAKQEVQQEEPSVVAQVEPNKEAEVLIDVESIRNEIKKTSMILARSGKSAQIKELSNRYGVVKQSDLDVTQVASYLEELKGIE